VTEARGGGENMVTPPPPPPPRRALLQRLRAARLSDPRARDEQAPRDVIARLWAFATSDPDRTGLGVHAVHQLTRIRLR